MLFRIYDIKWNAETKEANLPVEILLPVSPIIFESAKTEAEKQVIIENYIFDQISDIRNFCHHGFKYEPVPLVTVQDDNYVYDVEEVLFHMKIGDYTDIARVLQNYYWNITNNNYWMSDRMSNYIIAILIPLVLLRDLDLLVSAEDLKEVHTLEDLKAIGGSKFDLEILHGYLDYQVDIKLFKKIEKFLSDQNFTDLISMQKKYDFVKDNRQYLLKQFKKVFNNPENLLCEAIEEWKKIYL